jgi:hypothetical protein
MTQTLQPADFSPQSAPLTLRSIVATTGVILLASAVIGHVVLAV